MRASVAPESAEPRRIGNDRMPARVRRPGFASPWCERGRTMGLAQRSNQVSDMPEIAAERAQYPQELSIFHDVAKALTSSLNLNSVLQTIMDKMAEYFRPDTWSLLMVDDAKSELYFAIAVGDAAEMLKTVRLKVGEGIAGWVAKHGEPIIVPDVYSDPRFSRRVDEMTRWETRSII